MTLTVHQRLGIEALAGVALAYIWRRHGKLAMAGSFLLGGFVAASALNVVSPAKQDPPHIDITEPMVIR